MRTVRSVTFASATWDAQDVVGGKLALKGVRGTWQDVRPLREEDGKAPAELARAEIAKAVPTAYRALLCCPSCGTISALVKNVHTFSNRGVVSPTFECSSKVCAFKANVTLEGWNKKPLYAVAIEVTLPNGAIAPEIHYTHADTDAEARQQCGSAFPAGSMRIVGCGPAIGFFVNDSKGDALSAD